MTDPDSHIVCEPILFSAKSLHGTFFFPEGTAKAAVLMLSPLFDEKRCSYRAVVCTGRALAENGAVVLHPDLYATGNSAGNLSDVGNERWQEDILAAHKTLRERSGNLQITVAGFRAGALLAAQAISGGMPVDRFLLCQPVTDGHNYLNQLYLRRTIQHKMTGNEAVTEPYEEEGEILSKELYIMLQEMALPAEMPSISLSLLQCSFNDHLLGEYSRLVNQWGQDRLHVNKIVCEPFWLPHSPAEYTQLALAMTGEVFA